MSAKWCWFDQRVVDIYDAQWPCGSGVQAAAAVHYCGAVALESVWHHRVLWGVVQDIMVEPRAGRVLPTRVPGRLQCSPGDCHHLIPWHIVSEGRQTQLLGEELTYSYRICNILIAPRRLACRPPEQEQS